MTVRAGVRLDAAVMVGAVAMLASVALTIGAPPTLWSAGLGVVAVVGLARDPRLGVLGAAMLAVLTIPHGRAADNHLPMVAGIPLRFQDGVILAAASQSIPRLRWPDLQPVVVRLALAWLAVGVVAAGIGVADGHAVRDIARDARWWLLVAFLPLAFWTQARRQTLLRGFLAGTTVYAALIVATAVLPPYDGGLKAREYDAGLLRLQFNNAPFVLAAAAWVAHDLVRRPTIRCGAWFALLAAAVLVSLTRASLLAFVAVLAVVVVVAAAAMLGATLRVRVRRAAAIATLLAALALPGVATLALTASPPEAGPAAAVHPFERLLFRDPTAAVESIARGRGTAYAEAARLIAGRPLVGQGMGALIDVDWSPPGSRPATPGKQPGVDNAWLTVAVKAGLVGAVVYGLLLAWPLVEARRRRRDRHRVRLAPAWLGILALTMTQAFATVGYGPLVIALLVAVPSLAPGRRPGGLLG
jgi:hypothetical protein